MRTLFLVVVLILFSASSSNGSDTPLSSVTEEKGTPEKCKAFVLKAAQVLNQKGYKCRSILGSVYVCDNHIYHVESGCEGSEAWMEVFKQDGSDWQRFYK